MLRVTPEVVPDEDSPGGEWRSRRAISLLVNFEQDIIDALIRKLGSG